MLELTWLEWVEVAHIVAVHRGPSGIGWTMIIVAYLGSTRKRGETDVMKGYNAANGRLALPHGIHAADIHSPRAVAP